MEEGNIVSWFKEEGEEVEVGEMLVEVEIDKVIMEFDSYFDGVFFYIVVKEGFVFINDVIVVIGEEGEDWKVVIEGVFLDNGGVDDSSDDFGDEEVMVLKEEEIFGSFVVFVFLDNSGLDSDKCIKAFFFVCSMVKEVNIDFVQVNGFGDGGCIVKKDIEEVIE